MLDIERQKRHFENHVATLTDLGNIKILDFKKPCSIEYRIRFLFEEDYYRLHISGDLGELVATNYCNMCYEKFGDFVNSPYYFEEKIDCHSRKIYVFDEKKARDQVVECLKESDLYEDVVYSEYDFETEDYMLENFLDDAMIDFDDERGIGPKGLEVLEEAGIDIYDSRAYDFGKERTGIIELYLMAFDLATEQLKEQK